VDVALQLIEGVLYSGIRQVSGLHTLLQIAGDAGLQAAPYDGRGDAGREQHKQQ
jgi:hypothetical protein